MAWWSPLYVPLALALAVLLGVGLITVVRQFGVGLEFGLEHVVLVPLGLFIASVCGVERAGTRLRHQRAAIVCSVVTFLAVDSLRVSTAGTEYGPAADAIMIGAVVAAGWVFAAVTHLPRRSTRGDLPADRR